MRAILPLLVAVALLVGACTGTGRDAGAGVREIRIVASQFAYDPPEVRVKKGEKVRLVVTSKDVVHGLAIREYNVNRQITAGQEIAVEFEANREGRFFMYCTVFCGVGHADHKGVLVVEP